MRKNTLKYRGKACKKMAYSKKKLYTCSDSAV